MQAQKLSISLPRSSAEFIEQYRRVHSVKSRSEVIEQALRLLREQELEQAYRQAAENEKEFEDLEGTSADGIKDEAW